MLIRCCCCIRHTFNHDTRSRCNEQRLSVGNKRRVWRLLLQQRRWARATGVCGHCADRQPDVHRMLGPLQPCRWHHSACSRIHFVRRRTLWPHSRACGSCSCRTHQTTSAPAAPVPPPTSSAQQAQTATVCTCTRTRDFTWRGKVAEAATESVRVNKRVVHRKRWCVQVKHKRAFQVCLVPALSDSFPSNKQAGSSEHSNNTRLKRRKREKTGNRADTTMEGLWPKQAMLSPAIKKMRQFDSSKIIKIKNKNKK